jgi:hypothetical protein
MQPHNLKCSLDYTWIKTLEKFAPAAVSGKSKFPVFRTIDKLQAALKGVIDEASPLVAPRYGPNKAVQRRE